MRKPELWKEYPRNPRYLVSTQGNVLGITKGGHRRTLIPRIDRIGYVVYKVTVNGKHCTTTAHRMVAETFIDNPFGLSDVNHIDEDKQNNSVENLQWMSHKDNCNYGTRNEKARVSNSKMWRDFREWRKAIEQCNINA